MIPSDPQAPLWITEAEVAALIDLEDAITALEAGLTQEAAGSAHNMSKTHLFWGRGNTLHAIGAVFENAGVVGTKTWAHTEGGATPLLILYSAQTGALLAVIEAFVLGQLRTGGVSGVAAKLMSAPNAHRMAIVGAGKQSLAQIAAVAAVRPLSTVRVWSPTADKRQAFAAKASATLDITVEAAASLAEALDGAQIITLATRATEPFLSSAQVPAGAHLNAVGAISPERAEFEPDLLGRCATVAVDTLDPVRRLSREFRAAYGVDEAAWARVRPLSSLIAAPPARPARNQITLFKAMGMGVSDLSLGLEILARARQAGVGRLIPTPQKAAPRLTRRHQLESA